MSARSMWRQAGLLVGPALLLLLAVYLYPLGWLFVLSLTGGPGGAAGLDAYRRLAESSVYVDVLLRTTRISVLVTLVCLVAAYPVAYVMTRVGPTAVRVLMVFVLLPLWTSILVRTYAWMVLLQANGVLNNVLRWLRVIDEPLRLMYNETGVVIGMAQVLLPFAILPLYASLRSIDPRLSREAKNALSEKFPVNQAELAVYPANFACPSAVLNDLRTGERFGMSDVMSPWSGAAAEKER